MKSPEEKLLAELHALGESHRQESWRSAKNRVWSRLHQPSKKPLAWLQVAAVAVGAGLIGWIFFTKPMSAPTDEAFDVNELTEDEFALELYASVVAGEFDSAAAFVALDEGKIPQVDEENTEDSPTIYESFEDALPMDEVLLTYQSNLNGHGLLEQTSQTSDLGDW